MQLPDHGSKLHTGGIRRCARPDAMFCVIVLRSAAKSSFVASRRAAKVFAERVKFGYLLIKCQKSFCILLQQDSMKLLQECQLHCLTRSMTRPMTRPDNRPAGFDVLA